MHSLAAEFGDSIEISAPPAPWAEALGLEESRVLPLVAPRSEESAAALVAWAGRTKSAFCTVGGATKLDTGAAPNRCDFLLSTKYLQDVFDFDEGNSTIEAGAGILLRDLDSRTRASRQFVPLESFAGATLGGVASCNSSGARSHKWGAPRDLVLGARAILSDGRALRGGGKVVKNVSGYDLPKLFVGARGSLGLLTRLTIRLRPVPERSVRVVWKVADLDEAARLWKLLERPEFEWSGLRADFDGDSWAFSAWCEGSENAVALHLQRAPKPDSVEESSGVECEESWPGAIEVAARMPRVPASTWAEDAARLGARRVSWDCSRGALRASWDEVEWPKIEALRQGAARVGGWLSLERAPREWKSPERVWGAAGSDLVLAKRLKSAFDAAGVCSPGRGVGGI